MNISEAKEIPILDVVLKLGARVHKQTKPNEIWCFSFLRDEKTPSLKVNPLDNSFKDFGDHRKKGSAIDAIIDANNRDRKDKQAISEALKALEDFQEIKQKFKANHDEVTEYSQRYRVERWYPRIKAKGLLDEIHRRQLPVDHVEKYASQVLVVDNETVKDGKPLKFYAFGVKNDKGGVEVSSYYPKKDGSIYKFKNCIGPKAITTYPAEQKEVTAKCFSSWWDSATEDYLHPQQPNEECILYHGDSLVALCAGYIKDNPRINKVLHFRHMDNSGLIADAELAKNLEAAPLLYATMEQNYTGYKDLSEWKIANPSGAAIKIKDQQTWHEQLVKQPGTPKL